MLDPEVLNSPYYTPALKPILSGLVSRLHRRFANYHEQREATLEAIRWVLSQDILDINDLKTDPSKFFGTFELLGLAGGGSFATALGVQLLLAGGSLLNLAHPKLCNQYLPDIASGNILGCLAMTEVGHGSNVKGLATTARYDADTQEFIIDNVNHIHQQPAILNLDKTGIIEINYPDGTQNIISLNEQEKESMRYQAQKCFIGNGGYAHISVVIAQIYVLENNLWVHKGIGAFLVPMRNTLTNELMAGIQVTDLREKFGLNGVNNSLISYSNVRIPRRHLMMHNILSIKKDGSFEKLVSSPILSLYKSIQYGRSFITATSHSLTRVCLSIVMQDRHNDRFRPNSAYLVKWLSRVYGLHYAKLYLFQSLKGEGNDTLATGMKVLSTTYAHEMLDDLRNTFTSGQHLPILNRNLQEVFADWVASCTYEGDNPVIAQKVPGDLLMSLMMMTKGFHPLKDIPFLSNMFYKMTPGILSPSSLSDTMQRACWYSVVALALKLQTGLEPSLTKAQKDTYQAQIWNDCQIFIIQLAHLWTALSCLEIFQNKVSVVNRPLDYLAEYFAHIIYEGEFQRTMLHASALDTNYPFQSSNNRLLKHCLTTLKGLMPDAQALHRHNKRKAELLAMLEPHMDDFANALLGESDFVALVRQRLFTEAKPNISLTMLNNMLESKTTESASIEAALRRLEKLSLHFTPTNTTQKRPDDSADGTAKPKANNAKQKHPMSKL